MVRCGEGVTARGPHQAENCCCGTRTSTHNKNAPISAGLYLSKEGSVAGHLGEGYRVVLSRTSIEHFQKFEAREFISEASGRGRNDSLFEGAMTQFWKP